MPAAPTHPALTAGHVFIAASLDGYIARRDGAVDFLDPYTEDHGYDAFMAGIDGLIMGRATFELVMTFPGWPFTKPVVVLSRSLAPGVLPPTLAGKVRILDGTPREVMRDLYKDGWRNAYVDGGKVIQSFLRDGLIADLIVTRVPILLGDGIPLFGPLANDVALRHVETKTFASGLVQSKYEIRG